VAVANHEAGKSRWRLTRFQARLSLPNQQIVYNLLDPVQPAWDLCRAFSALGRVFGKRDLRRASALKE
jgi:hypothetical protein